MSSLRSIVCGWKIPSDLLSKIVYPAEQALHRSAGYMYKTPTCSYRALVFMVEINIGLIEKAESGLGSSSEGWYYVKRKELLTLSDPANK